MLTGRRPWVQESSQSELLETCADSYKKMDEYIRVISSQLNTMQKYITTSTATSTTSDGMNGNNGNEHNNTNTVLTLTIYTTYESSIGCDYKDRYPNIILVHFNALDLLREYGYTKDLIGYMTEKWNIMSYSRISDVLRLMLAHKYKKTYIDLDIVFLYDVSINSSQPTADTSASVNINRNADTIDSDSDSETVLDGMAGMDRYSDRHIYHSPLQLVNKLQRHFITSAVWNGDANGNPGQGGCGNEYSNCAFCLPRPVLVDLLGVQRRLIRSKMEAWNLVQDGRIDSGNSNSVNGNSGNPYFYTELGPSLFQKVGVCMGDCVYVCVS